MMARAELNLTLGFSLKHGTKSDARMIAHRLPRSETMRPIDTECKMPMPRGLQET